jgi:inner membrane protein YidH
MTEPASPQDPVAPPATPRDQVAPPSVRDHLANERTLLSWVRTALTLMGLGFLIDRFAAQGQTGDVYAYLGIVLVVLGGLVAVAGGYSYLSTRRQLATGSFRSSVGLHLAMVVVVVAGAVLLALFLLNS